MEQGSENGLIILTDGALNKPTQNAEDTTKVVRAGSGCISELPAKWCL